MNHTQEINSRVAPHRQKMDFPLNVKEEIRATEKLNAKRAGVRVPSRSDGRRRWFSFFPQRLRANAVPYLLIGSGLMIGGIVMIRDRRRRRAIIMRDFSAVAKDISPVA